MRTVLGLIAVLSSGAVLAQQPAPPPAPMSDAECAVWARERSFALSAERHDFESFREHLHPGAVFIAGPRLSRGADAIVQAWTPIIEGKTIVLRWNPERVVIGGAPDVALSEGPYTIENPDPDAKQRFATGRFISTWVKNDDGQWRVLFDGGGGGVPLPATEEDVRAMQAEFMTTCPQS
jgi:ketosteroid isomerase-like protein